MPSHASLAFICEMSRVVESNGHNTQHMTASSSRRLYLAVAEHEVNLKTSLHARVEPLGPRCDFACLTCLITT
jgi:hypothetical protein